MKNTKAYWGIIAVLLGFSGVARADQIAGCNYTFYFGRYEDRGTIQILKSGPSGIVMRIIQDDTPAQFTGIQVTSANGDQARSMIQSDANFKQFAGEAHIFPDEVEKVVEYLVPPKDGSKTPQATFFSFYGKDNRYLGGFGVYGNDPYVCDWV